MFWALILQPYKGYLQCVSDSFHVSMASLDISLADDTPVQIMVNYKKKNFLLCTLNKNSSWQVPLDLNFEKGTTLMFFCNGKAPVHLTGYILPKQAIGFSYTKKEEYNEDNEEDVTTNEEDQEIIDIMHEKTKKRKATEVLKNLKKLKRTKQTIETNHNKSNGQDSYDWNTEEHMSELSQIENTDENEDDEDSDEKSEEESTESECVQPEYTHEQEKKISTKCQQQEKKEKQSQHQHQKKQDKQNNLDKDEKNKNKQKNKKQKKKKEKQEAQLSKNDQNEAKKKPLEEISMVEIKLGDENAKVASHGKLCSIHYVGRYKIGKQEKKFDSCIQGAGFKFRLGKGEVIKGLDYGIVGMRVGGKRRLTIPPKYGFQSKDVPQLTPGNNILVFDVELKKVED